MNWINNLVSKLTRQKKQREDLLREALETAKNATLAKSAFLANMSHEIRTPMNAIIGIAEIQLQDETLKPEQREAFSKIFISGDLLLNLINDILDLSKIEAGKLELVNAPYDVASLIYDTTTVNMMRIGSKQIEFGLHVDESIPSISIGDELRIKQVLNNILSNAIKYTRSGTVKLSVTAEPDGNDADTVTLVFTISDTGQGMTPEQVNNLFDEYAQFNAQANRTTEGTGLGMSITKNLIGMMNGTISVKSDPGKGTLFTVHLPQGRADSGVLGADVAKNLQGFRAGSRTSLKRGEIVREPMPYGSVLVVDDVGTNIYVARGLLLPYKLKIDSVDSGYAAIEKVRNGNVYDIIFMDHMMPHMDGIQATKVIRDMGYDKPVVALTANAIAGQVEVFLENGFDDYISKPIDVRQLNTVLNKLIRDKQPPEVIKKARLLEEAGKPQSPESTNQLGFDSRYTDAFIRDAEKSIAALDAIIMKGAYADEADMQSYTIHVHGMKGALAYIGQSDLSAFAARLEKAGRDKNSALILEQAPVFLSLLRNLLDELAG